MTETVEETLPIYRNWHELIHSEPIEVDAAKHTATYGKFVCQPLERGFAATIGNSLRRILLSSIQGTAITSVKIEGALHEFTSMEDVKEDVSEIIINLKQVRLQLASVEKQVVTIDKKGPCEITASDINGGGMEVMNGDQLICTLTAEVDFHAELTVEWGKGYQTAEKQSKEDLDIGQIPIDAIFTPIRQIQFGISNARVGQQTDYDKLTIEVETDGSVKPENALAFAAKILKEQLTPFINFDEAEVEPEKTEEDLGDIEPLNPNLNKPVEDLELSVRSANCLKNADINFIGELTQKSDQEMLKTKNFGRKSLNEIKALLTEMDLTLGMKIDNWTPPEVAVDGEDTEA